MENPAQEWTQQRNISIGLALALPIYFYILFSQRFYSQEAWVEFFQNTFFMTFSLLTLFALASHIRHGLGVIIDDYIKCIALRQTCFAIIFFFEKASWVFLSLLHGVLFLKGWK